MRYALVTGATGGIGTAVVRRLCQDGCYVYVGYHHSQQKALHICAGLSCCQAVFLDVTDFSAAAKQMAEIERDCGHLDVLVNNAGIAQQKLFTDITDDDWSRMVQTNLGGVFACCRAALPGMIRRKYGRIVNIASMWGQMGASCEVHYSAAKAGVIGLTRALAKETALSGITVNCVSPGAIDTAMMHSFSQADIAAFCEEIPMGRLGSPTEVAAAVSFFASEEASYITGQVLGVNGGMV